VAAGGCPTTTATRSATPTPPATWPASPRHPNSGPWSAPRPAAAAPTTSANSSSWASSLDLEPRHQDPARRDPERGHLPRPRNLHALAATLAFIVNDPHQWLAERLAELDAGNIEAIIGAANEYPLYGVKATDRDKAPTYVQTNTVRMRYAHYRKLGMFIGSGNVEAGGKAVIGQRLKLSGMLPVLGRGPSGCGVLGGCHTWVPATSHPIHAVAEGGEDLGRR
jgi:hypothetical protein